MMTALSLSGGFIMPLLARTLIAVILCAVFGVLHSLAAQTPASKNEADASVSGKVTIKGKPAVGIVVGLHSASQPGLASASYKATTDQEGLYRINNIADGRYEIAPIAPALVPSDLNNPNRQTLVLTDGDTVENINFDLVRGGVVTGKVTDTEGRPLVDMNVRLRIVGQQPQRRMNPDGQTDDRGVYRIFGIPSGRYRVAVDDPRRYSRGAAAYLPTTYYPDVQNTEKAGVIEVAEGFEVSNIDIKVGAPPQRFSVSGRIIDETGQPVSKVRIGLSSIIVIDANLTSYESGDNGTVSDEQGRFRLTNVQAGKYELSIHAGEEGDLQPHAPVQFDVSDADVNDLLVNVVKGALIAGTVVIEGPRLSPQTSLQTSVIVYTTGAGGLSWAASTPVKPDGSFVIGGVRTGTLTFKMGSWNRNHGFTLNRIERDGVVQNAIQIQGAEHVTGIRLFVSYSSGSIRGVVKISNGTLPAGSRISAQVSQPEDANLDIGEVEIDTRGHFLIEGLAAGTYQLLVFVHDPQTGKGPVMSRQQVTVTDGGVTDVIVTLDLTPLKPGP